jgi:hypothetical protein
MCVCVCVEKQNGEEATGGSDCCPPYNKDIGHNSKNIVSKTPSSAEPAVAQSVFMLRVSVNASSATKRDAISIFLNGRTELVVTVIWFTI